MPESMLVYCTHFNLVELRDPESRALDERLRREEQYKYVLLNDVRAGLRTQSFGVVHLKLTRGFLVDGESNPLKKIKGVGEIVRFLVDRVQPGEWLVHDYLYGAESDPKAPLSVHIPTAEKDAVFQSAYRRLGLAINRKVQGEAADNNAVNDYAPEHVVAAIQKEADNGQRTVITGANYGAIPQSVAKAVLSRAEPEHEKDFSPQRLSAREEEAPAPAPAPAQPRARAAKRPREEEAPPAKAKSKAPPKKKSSKAAPASKKK